MTFTLEMQEQVVTLKRDNALKERYVFPPFTILNAQSGDWQKRKRLWINLGIKGEIGRDAIPGRSRWPASQGGAYGAPIMRGDSKGRPIVKDENGEYHYPGAAIDSGAGRPDDLMFRGKIAKDLDYYRHKEAGKGIDSGAGRAEDLIGGGEGSLYGGGWFKKQGEKARAPSGTSIFDPVVCELVYRWFSPMGGHIFDPFAGGSVRGIVATILDRQYTGVDLSPRQVAANKVQAKAIGTAPTWICGDSLDVTREMLEMSDYEFDMIFSCPPYYDLEVYSDDPADLSNMSCYEEFLDSYRAIIAQSARLLRNNRFACFVVGDVRDDEGFYYNFVGDTISAFKAAGMRLYNEAILITAIGSLPIRVQANFNVGRKLGKTHQNILVFYKGDPKEIRNEFPVLEDEGTQSALFT